MKRRLTMRLTFDLAEVLEALRAKYPEIPTEATLKVVAKPGSTGKDFEVVVSYDLPCDENFPQKVGS